jgi:benzoyl-CoA reductase subunit C
MTTLETFKKIAKEQLNQPLRNHKDSGGRVIGIFCSYVPEEIIMAAGMVPFRIRAVTSTKTTLGDAWFSSYNCSYVRHLMDLALEGRFRFLDGIVFINACDHIRRMFDNWKAALDYPPFIHLVAVPHKRSRDALAWYRQELDILKRKIENQFKVTITDDALREAIRGQNQVRNLLSQLYELRKTDRPPITGAETLSVVMAGTALPREDFVHLLDQLLEEIPGREPYPEGLPRVMIQSGCLEDIEHLELVEGQGCAVVDDSLCFGRRYFDRPVHEDSDDPLQALAERYLLHLSCPRISNDFPERLKRVKQSVQDFRLDGLICEKLKFCDLWGGEAFILRKDSRNTGLPVLTLERELYGGGSGQIKTRVQAFLERIGKI